MSQKDRKKKDKRAKRLATFKTRAQQKNREELTKRLENSSLGLGARTGRILCRAAPINPLGTCKVREAPAGSWERRAAAGLHAVLSPEFRTRLAHGWELKGVEWSRIGEANKTHG